MDTSTTERFNYHIEQLEKIIRLTTPDLRSVEGNCVYQHATLTRSPELQAKRDNLYNLAQSCQGDILEIGFNAGGSALVFLLANTHSKIYLFDINEHSYVLGCYEYLQKEFNNRLEMYIGSSTETLPLFLEVEPKNIGLYHIDGCHHKEIAEQDFNNCYELFKLGDGDKEAVVIFDDVDFPWIDELWKQYISENKVKEFKLRDVKMYNHAFGFFRGVGGVGGVKSKIAVLTLNVGDEYRNIVKEGIKNKVDYCSRRDYALIGIDVNYDNDLSDVIDLTRPIAWSKVNLIRKVLESKKYDYLVWIDADAYIMNMDIDLQEIIKSKCEGDIDILLAQDYLMINTGVMFIKNTDWSRKFFKSVYDVDDEMINHSNWEQASMINHYKENISDTQKHLKVLDASEQCLFNSYYYNYVKGNFILHLAGCFRLGINMGLDRMMDMYCPHQKSDETSDDFLLRREAHKL
jgi:predicted O-methyltransferase YrrM